ncbi:MAG: response regulator transcription factor [Flavobacteriaceae bacterium]|nr:response regulator transcription factor [Flavobacteriaceae bacterium]
MISICIIEDLIEIQQGLQSVFERDDRLEFLKSFSSAEEAISEMPYLCPDIVVTDINLPGKSGIEAIVELKEVLPETQFIMFTIYEDHDLIFDALKAGASGYILKNTSSEKIVESVIDLYNGGSPMSPIIARKVIASFNAPVQYIDQSVNQLISKREQEVLELLSKGFLYKEIADKLSISMSTVKRHLNHIYVKLHVQNKTEAVNKLYGR